MDIFKDHIHSTLFDVNHKVGCTGILQAFLKEMDLLREAQRFSYWPHDYRIQVHYKRRPFTGHDEDLYEQGVFPSRFNGDHKWTWTMHNRVSWSPKSMNVFDLLSVLDDCEILSVELVDTNYDHSKSQVDQTLGDAEAFIEVVLKKTKPRYKYGQ